MLLGKTQTEGRVFERGYDSFIPQKLNDANRGQDIVVVWHPDQILPYCVIHKSRYPETLEFCAPKRRSPEELEEFRRRMEERMRTAMKEEET